MKRRLAVDGTHITSEFKKRVIDYIFFQNGPGSGLVWEHRLWFPYGNHCRACIGDEHKEAVLPSNFYPSDHYAIGAEFGWEEDRKKQVAAEGA